MIWMRNLAIAGLLAVVLAAFGVALMRSDRGGTPAAARDSRLSRFAEVPALYQSMGGDTSFPLTLYSVKGLAREPSTARGWAVVNFRDGAVQVRVNGLPRLPEGESYQVLLVDNKSGPGNTVAIEWGPEGDDIVSLGVLPTPEGEATLNASVDVERLRTFEVDMVAVVRRAAGGQPEFVIGSLTSLLYKFGRELSRAAEEENVPLDSRLLFGPAGGGRIPGVSKAYAKTTAARAEGLLAQIQEGQTLFFQGTFGGNGRTCGTCHLLNASFTINADDIAALPANDPMFVFETMPALANLENGAFLRGPRGLILENIDGFSKAPVFRGPPTILNLNFTGPFGLSSEIATLTEFCLGAVIQHLPKSLNRVAGVDFTTPTQGQLNAMEAFQLSRFLPSGQNFNLDQFATTQAQQNGRTLFFGAAKCAECHGGNVLAIASQAQGGGNRAFNTGVVNLPINTGTAAGFGPLPAEAAGLRAFSTPPLFGVRDTAPFFHDHSAATLREAVAFYESSQFNQSPGGAAVGGINLTGAQINDIVAFLEGLVELPSGTTGTVTGAVTLQGRAPTTGVNVGHGLAVVTLTSGTTTLRGSVRQDGAFTIPRVPVGTYTATASAQGYLSAQRTNVVVTSGDTTSLPAVQLRLGRVNPDIAVDIIDLSAVVQSLGTTPATRLSAQGFFVDNNGDGAVEIVDLSGIVNSLGLTSPTSWP
jgi:cytochrome c peroxidase